MLKYPVRFDHLIINARLLMVLFPIDPLRLRKPLLEQGFIPNENLPRVAPPGTRFQLGGAIARKGDVAITLDTEKMVIGVTALDLDTLLVIFSELEAIVLKSFDLNLKDKAYFFEFVSSGSIQVDQNPLAQMKEKFKDVPFVRDAADILQMDIAPFGLRLVQAGSQPNQPHWTEIKIEPDLLDSTQILAFDVVMRDPDRDKVRTFAKNLPTVLSQLVEALTK